MSDTKKIAKKKILLSIPEKTHDIIRNEAQTNGVSVTTQINLVLNQFINSIKD